MFAKVYSGALLGIDGAKVEVEVHITGRKLPRFITVGLPEGAVKESKERVQAAIRNSGYNFPNKHITVNLAPADLRKEGTAFDLPIAIGILSTMGILSGQLLMKCMILGELSLNGKLRKIKGVLSLVLAAKELGFESVFLPAENLEEGRAVEGIKVLGARSLNEVIDLIKGKAIINETRISTDILPSIKTPVFDFQDIKGQLPAKRAMEIAAAGGHNILMVGPPGSGKTMLAKRLAGILPGMSIEESLETTRIYSVAGLIKGKNGLIRSRPFRSPHHTISDVGLTGGGQYPKPGEVSLAHNGVLFLDELPEFKKNVLEVMRQPVENGEVNISRAMVTICFPSKFMLVAAMNPCPCGFISDPKHECTCSSISIQKYVNRISGPLMDRIDIHIEVPAVPFKELSDSARGEPSSEIQKRVESAMNIQRKRFDKDLGIYCNSQMLEKHVERFCRPEKKAMILLENAIERLGLSARAYNRILKVARTIADLEQCSFIMTKHIAEAVHYRNLDRKWA